MLILLGIGLMLAYINILWCYWYGIFAFNEGHLPSERTFIVINELVKTHLWVRGYPF